MLAEDNDEDVNNFLNEYFQKVVLFARRVMIEVGGVTAIDGRRGRIYGFLGVIVNFRLSIYSA